MDGDNRFHCNCSGLGFTHPLCGGKCEKEKVDNIPYLRSHHDQCMDLADLSLFLCGDWRNPRKCIMFKNVELQ